MGGRRSIFRVVDPFLLVLGAVVLVGVGVLIGVLIEGGDDESSTAVLQTNQIGDAEAGRELFVSQGCAMCHTYEGAGGSDAPPLDFMRGRMTANDIANMSGLIWNHVPTMQAAFEEEGIPFPEFEDDEMADLVAYLHGGGPPPDVPESMEEEHSEGDHDGGEETGAHADGGEETGAHEGGE